MDKNNQKEYKGYNGAFVLMDNAIVIKRGFVSALLGHGLKGNKTIPYSSIVAVQMKRAGFTAGYIQLTLKGGSEAKGGLFQAAQDENTVCFYKNKNNDFEECKKLVEDKIAQNDGNRKQPSGLDDLEKLAELKKKGIISDSEFNAKKKQLLGL